MKKKLIAVLLCSALILACAGCNNKPQETEDADIIDEPVDRIMLSFALQPDINVATARPESTIEHFMYYVAKGEYDTALNYCYMPDGTLFDENALQQAVLADGIGRGESIAFYKVNCSNNVCSFEYDLTLGTQVGTYNKKLAYIQAPTGGYYIDLAKCGYLAEGKLVFGVPRYVDAYINGVYVDKKYLDSSFTYTIANGVARTPEKTTIKNKDGTTSTELSDASLTLTLKTNFGVSQDYPLVFLGQSKRNKNAVNDSYYKTNLNHSVFTIDCTRELRESALEYISTKVLPTLVTDLVKSHSWEVADIQKLFGAETQSNAMFSDYYATYRKFLDAQKEENGSYFYLNPNVYNIRIVDVDKRSNTNTQISDWNVADFAVTFDYNWLYTMGKNDTEYNKTGNVAGVISLSYNENGEWYVNNLSSTIFGLSAAR